MSAPMKIRARLQGDKTQVIVSMDHEMETGQRKDASGKIVPAWFIQSVVATHNGKTVFSGQFGPAVAKNPNIGFRLIGAKVGDKIAISWVDNRGDKRTDEVAVTAA